MANKDCDHKNCVYILVADDDESTVDLIKYAAEYRGWCVDTAYNVREIIEAVNRHCNSDGICYDAIIADLHYFSRADAHFPRLTGVTAARSIREVYKDIPIIFVTGFSTILVDEEASKVSNEIMTKPVDLDKLLDRVKYYISVYGTKYQGEEKRRRSINLSGEHRRVTDKVVEINSAVSDSIIEVRNDKLESLRLRNIVA